MESATERAAFHAGDPGVLRRPARVVDERQLVVALADVGRVAGSGRSSSAVGLSSPVELGFVAMAAGPAPALTPLAGYAAAGAVFALVGLLRLRGSARAA